MAFDAAMLSSVVYEIDSIAAGGRIEKIYQPEKEEIILQMRTTLGGKKLLLNCSSSNPRISFTDIQKENPAAPPMLCMLLRKHLTGAFLVSVKQLGFERAAVLEFDTRDELGYECKKYLIAEIMGKYSNLIFADADMKVISALKIIDYSTSSQRQVLPGMRYELPPAQNKLDPQETDRDSFASAYESYPDGGLCEKFITSTYLGLSSATAREMVMRSTGCAFTTKDACDADTLYLGFSCVMDLLKRHELCPSVVYGDSGVPAEYSFMSLTHYGEGVKQTHYTSLSEMLDEFFRTRDKEARIRQRASDILKILTRAESRILKKLDAQRSEISECEKASEYKKCGDMINANIYKISRLDKVAYLTDYESWDEDKGEYATRMIELDTRLSPSANAQKYYKKYSKLKTAKAVLGEQITKGEEELEYIRTVLDSLSRAETLQDLAEIREELYRSGYASRMKGYVAQKKHPAPIIAKFKTTNGYTVYCGKNNLQNEYITHKLAQKNDYWFHAKGVPGSHVLLVTGGDEPPAQDFTDAAEIAAYYSKSSGGASTDVDYLFARGVKKVLGARPGMVIYHSNWSCTVTPDKDKIQNMRVK